MSQESGEYDEVNKVLLECEMKLRMLQQEGRLTGEGLREFMELSSRVRAEIDRRQQPDRRTAMRGSPDRRALRGAPVRESVEPV